MNYWQITVWRKAQVGDNFRVSLISKKLSRLCFFLPLHALATTSGEKLTQETRVYRVPDDVASIIVIR